MKPTIVTQDILWEKLDVIEKILSTSKQRRMFEGLLVNDVVKDLKVTAEFVIKEWILTGKLKAINVGGKDRIRGGWRISKQDYIDFLETLIADNNREKEKVVFIKSPQQIIDEFHKRNSAA